MTSTRQALQTSGDAELQQAQTASRRTMSVFRALNQTPILIAGIDALLVVGFGLASPGHAFWSAASLRNILADVAVPLMMVGCMALLLGCGEFDLSIGANVILSSVLGGEALLALQRHGAGLGVALVSACLVALVTGVVLGALNGVATTLLRIASLISTLAVAGIATGVASIVTDGTDLTGIQPQLQSDFGTATVLGVVPWPLIPSAFTFLALWFIAARTRFGLRIAAIGSSSDAAYRAGLRVYGIRTTLFIAVGAIAGLAAMLDLTRFAGTNLAGHQGDSLAALSAAVIGGTSMRGGRIRMAGGLAGALLAVLLQSGLVIAGLSSFYQQIAIGITLIAAVALDQRRSGHAGHLVRPKATS